MTGDLFSREPIYPDVPGYKATGPSSEAAKIVTASAARLRDRVLECFKDDPTGRTADEVATLLNCSVLSVRPRVAELHRAGTIERTSARRKNSSGMSASVWRIERSRT